MKRVTIRLPTDLIRAYDMADAGSRSAIMRRVLTDAVADGDVQGVPPDLRKLAERERVVDSGRYARKRATFKSRLYGFYAEKWDDGAVTPTDAAELAASWRGEAALYDDDADGTPHADLLDAILDWYRANWSRTAAERPEWPDAGRLLRAAGIGAGDESGGLSVRQELVDELEDLAANGVDSREALAKIAERDGVSASDAFEAIACADGYDERAAGTSSTADGPTATSGGEL